MTSRLQSVNFTSRTPVENDASHSPGIRCSFIEKPVERERRGLFTPTNQAGRGKETGRTERKRERERERKRDRHGPVRVECRGKSDNEPRAVIT